MWSQRAVTAVVVLTVGGWFGNVPAQAATATADCGFNTIAQDTVTGSQDTFTGGAYGYAVSDQPGASISVYCEVRVNGVSAGAQATTAAGPAGQASATAGQVTYTAAETDTLTLCAVWTGSESGEACGGTPTQQIPPDEVFDLLDDVFDLYDAVLDEDWCTEPSGDSSALATRTGELADVGRRLAGALDVNAVRSATLLGGPEDYAQRSQDRALRAAVASGEFLVETVAIALTPAPPVVTAGRVCWTLGKFAFKLIFIVVEHANDRP